MFKVGEDVAVMPKDGTSVITIETIAHIDEEFVWLKDGGVFRLPAGESLRKPRTVYIVPATDAHYSSLRRSKPR